LAKALYRAYRKNITSTEEKVKEAISFFKDLELDIEKSYLNPNSIDDYDFILKGVFSDG
jgi:archaellum biogenesis ATPase FlaH